MSDYTKYGNYYWCIKTVLSQSGELFVHADGVEVSSCGDLLCHGTENRTVLAISAGKWDCFYAASCVDGSPVAVEHWDGETVSSQKHLKPPEDSSSASLEFV